MLASLVEPEASQSKTRVAPPQKRAEAPVQKEQPQEAPRAEAPSPERPQAPEKEQTPQTTSEEPAPPTGQKPPSKTSKPRGAEKQPAEKTADKTADQAEPAGQTVTGIQVPVAAAPVPTEFPKPLANGEAAPEPETVATPLAMAPLVPPPLFSTPEAVPPQSTPLSEQKAEVAGEQTPVEQPMATPIPLEELTRVQVPAAPMPSQAPQEESVASPETEALPSEVQAARTPTPLVFPQALPSPKATPEQGTPIQEKDAPEKTTDDTQEPLSRKLAPSVSTEATREPLKKPHQANSTQEAPTTQTAEAALGLKPPSPKPALTEFLSRPAPAMETPSVVQAIQEARNSSTTPSAIPTAPLPGMESSQGSDLFQGREFHGGQGTQAPPQANPTGNISTGFTLNAPVAAQAKATVPEVAATRPSLPMEQMEGTVRWVLKNQQNSAELQLRPESLGKVSIQLKVEGNQVHAKVWASEPSTVPLLESHRGMLETSLREQGLSLGSFDLHQGQGSPRHPTEQSTGQASFAGPVMDFPREPSVESPAPSLSGVFGKRRVEVLA